MAIGNPYNGRAFDEQHMNGRRSTRHVLRFGQKLVEDDVPTVPARYRGIDTPLGKLVGGRVRAASGEIWLRLRPNELRRRMNRGMLTVPLNGTQSPAPTPDALELRSDMRVYCHDGYVGRLEGIVIDPSVGVAIELILRIRGNVMAGVRTATSPMASLIGLNGQQVLVPPSWIHSTKIEPSDVPFRGPSVALHLDASAEQVASGTRLRTDAEIASDVWTILVANPAVGPYAGDLQVAVQDGNVTLQGQLPSPRHRASAEQDIWHVPGVFGLRDDVRIQQ
ncbi:MAG: BON domain-containing protein [Ktedonobacterales bacterium]